MSCGCSNNINYPSGCGSSSCSSCNSCTSVSCDQVIYSGPNLVCSGIDNEDNLCVALQKLDDTICNIPLTTVTASNGLYKNGSDIRMGGALIEPTVISASATFTISLTGLVSDPLPDYLVTETTTGVIRRTLTSTLTSNILSLITANNGITKTGNNLQLGGSLIQPTTITTTGTNTLSIPGLVNNTSATYIVSIDNTTGLLTKSPLSTIVPPNITADNGLTKTGANVQLGGLLIQPTGIATTVTETLSITGLVITSSPAYILTETNSGVVQMTATSTLTSNILSGITADNGLTKTLNNIQLGGPLIQNTNVSLAGYTLTLKDIGSANTGLEIIPGASAPTNWTTSNVNIFSGKVYSDDLVWVDDNNVGIGIMPVYSGTDIGAPRLYVYKAISAVNPNPLGINCTSYDQLIIGSSVTSLSTTNKYASSYSKLEFRPGADITVSGAIDKFVSTSLSEFIFEPSGSVGDTVSNGKISAIAARGYFAFGRDLDSFATIRIASSVSDGGNPYTGTLGEHIGLKVENLRANGTLSAQTTTTYGIKQLGADDRNYFNGTFQLPSTNVSIGTATLVAGDATIATTAITTGSKVFISVNTPGGTQGFLFAPAGSIINGVSFKISSTSVTDTSTVNWWIINN